MSNLKFTTSEGDLVVVSSPVYAKRWLEQHTDVHGAWFEIFQQANDLEPNWPEANPS